MISQIEMNDSIFFNAQRGVKLEDSLITNEDFQNDDENEFKEEEFVIFEGKLEIKAENSVVNCTFGEEDFLVSEINISLNSDSRDSANFNTAPKHMSINKIISKATRKKRKNKDKIKSDDISGSSISGREYCNHILINSSNYKNVLFGMSNSKNSESESVLPYDQLTITNTDIVDYYLKDCNLPILKQKKKINKNTPENSSTPPEDLNFLPPFPSKVLRKYIKRKNIHLNSKINKKILGKKEGYFTSRYLNYDLKKGIYAIHVKCSDLGVNEKYLAQSYDMPYSKLKEYVAMKYLKMLFPKVNNWADLLEVIKKKFKNK